MEPSLVVRVRTDADLGPCVVMLRALYERDRYPAYLPPSLRRFLVSPDAYEAWVAEQSGRLVGHVALHRGGPGVALASEALRQPAERLGVVARLFVDPSARRTGAGRALLDVALRDAVARRLWPILDVATHLRAAIDMYENCGWRRLGALTFRFDDDRSIDEYVYVGPLTPEPTS